MLLVILVLSMKFSGYSVADFLFLIGLLFPPDGFDHDVDSFTVQYLFFHYRPLPTITSITAKKYFFHCPSSRTADPVYDHRQYGSLLLTALVVLFLSVDSQASIGRDAGSVVDWIS